MNQDCEDNKMLKRVSRKLYAWTISRLMKINSLLAPIVGGNIKLALAVVGIILSPLLLTVLILNNALAARTFFFFLLGTGIAAGALLVVLIVVGLILQALAWLDEITINLTIPDRASIDRLRARVGRSMTGIAGKFQRQTAYNDKTAPGSRWLQVVKFFFPPKTVELTFKPVVGDWREEYYGALQQKRFWKAHWINVRYNWIIIKTMGFDRLVTLLKTLLLSILFK